MIGQTISHYKVIEKLGEGGMVKVYLAEARAYYSHVLFILNRSEEALLQIKRARELDPFNPLYGWLYAMDLNYLHRYDEATGELRQTLES